MRSPISVAAATWQAGERRELSVRLKEAQANLRALRGELKSAAGWARELEVERARIGRDLKHERLASGERAEAWESAREQLVNEFARLSQDASASNNEQFLSLAARGCGDRERSLAGELSQRQQAIDALVRPLHRAAAALRVRASPTSSASGPTPTVTSSSKVRQ